MVIFDVCGEGTVGTNHWLVHFNTGSGFSETPTTFSLPAGYITTPWRVASRPGRDCSAASIQYPGFALLDMNADRTPDIVVYDECGTSTVGDDHWNVHLLECR